MSSARFGGTVGAFTPRTSSRAPTRALFTLFSFSLISALCLLTPARAEVPTGWRQLPVSGPGARMAPAIAYDSGRNRVVLFGGFGTTSSFGDTWEWDGAKWAQVATTGPSPRNGAAMVYDSTRGKIVLFGGRTSMAPPQTFFGDTWTWDGSQWTQVATTGPSPRFNPAMAFDKARGYAILFGGGSTGPLGGTWKWDGSQWTQLSVAEPSARSSAAVAYDSTRQRVVLFGGGNPDAPSDDTFEWDGTKWVKVATAGPGARYAGMVYDFARGRCVLYGGMSRIGSGFLGDTWEWDGSAWAQVAVTGPSPRWGAGMAYDSAHDQLILVGGWYTSPNTVYEDTWVYAPVSAPTGWHQLDVTGPAVRTGHIMVYDSARGRTVLFGGATRGTGTTLNYYGDTWEWDGTRWTQVNVTGPSPRWSSAAAYDSGRGKVVLFSGSTQTGLISDTWEYDGSQWTRVTTSGPSARAWSRMAYDPIRAKSVLYGGTTSNGETYGWDGTKWTRLATQGPSYRGGGVMEYDAARQQVIYFGGASSTTSFGDTWAWDGNKWTQVATNGPSPRTPSGTAYDSDRQKIVLFGGFIWESPGTYFNDTWEWDGSAWTQVESTGPAPRWGSAMVYDKLRKQIVLFGGNYLDPAEIMFNDTWVYLTAIMSPFTADDAVHALQWAAGLATISQDDLARYDVETSGTSAGLVDMGDACRIARKVGGLEANP